MAARSVAQWLFLFVVLGHHAVGATLMGKRMRQMAKGARKQGSPKELATKESQRQHKAMRSIRRAGAKALAKIRARAMNRRLGHYEDYEINFDSVEMGNMTNGHSEIDFDEMGSMTNMTMCNSPEFHECLRRCTQCLDCAGDDCKDANGDSCDTCDLCNEFLPCLGITPPKQTIAIHVYDWDQDGCLPGVEPQDTVFIDDMLENGCMVDTDDDGTDGSFKVQFDGFKVIITSYHDTMCMSYMDSSMVYCGCGKGALRLEGPICDDVPEPVGFLNENYGEGGCPASPSVSIPVPPLHSCLESPVMFSESSKVYMKPYWEGPRLRMMFYWDSMCNTEYHPEHDHEEAPMFSACVCPPEGYESYDITSPAYYLSGPMCTPDKMPTGKVLLTEGTRQSQISVWNHQCLPSGEFIPDDGLQGRPMKIVYSTSVHYVHIYKEGDYGCQGESEVVHGWVCGKCREECQQNEYGMEECFSECFEHFAGCYQHHPGHTCTQVPRMKVQQHDLSSCSK